MAAFNSNRNNVVHLEKHKKESNLFKRLLILNIALTILQLGMFFWQEFKNAGF